VPLHIPTHVSYRTVDGTAVIIDQRQGSYFGLDAIATRIWLSIAETGSTDAAVPGILDAYKVDEATARQDATRLVGELLKKGLIQDDARQP
jgi:hypothetical protein